MKFIKQLTVVACAFALLTGNSFAAEAKSCCDKAKAAGKECTHPCCVEAAKEKKVCEKCNKKKEDKKQETK